jgi:hypothetical protein
MTQPARPSNPGIVIRSLKVTGTSIGASEDESQRFWCSWGCWEAEAKVPVTNHSQLVHRRGILL